MIGCLSNLNFGQPSLLGRRLTVHDIVSKVYYERDLNVAIEEYEIQVQDVKEALVYCMNLRCRVDTNRLHYCSGCILRTISEGRTFKPEDYEEMRINGESYVVSKDGKSIFAGSLGQFENEEFGDATWITAEELVKTYGELGE